MTEVMSMTTEQILTRAARVHLREGRVPQAQALVGAWRQRAPGAALPQALQALLELAAGRVEQARTLAQHAVARDAHCGLAYFALAQVYLAEGRADDAATSVQRACTLAPDDTEAVRLLAQLRAEAGELAQAEALLRAALTEDAADVQTQLMLIELLLNRPQGDMQEVERLARAACEAAPHVASAWALHGVALAALGDEVTARARLALALELEPDQPAYLLQLARLHLNDTGGDTGALDEAAALARRAAVLAPQDWRGPALLAQILRRQRRLPAAMKVLAEASKALPQRAELLLELAQACAESGQFLAGEQALERATALSAPALTLESVRAELQLRQGNLAAACAAFEAVDAIEHAGRHRLTAPLSLAQAQDQTVGLIARSIGQCLLFVRYAARLAALGTRVKLAAPPFLATLLARVPGIDEVVTDERLGADWIESVLRLPTLLGLQAAPLFDEPYLKPDPAAVARVRTQRGAHAGPCVLIDLGPDPDPALLHRLGQWLLQRQATALLLSGPVEAWRQSGVRCQQIAAGNIDELTAWIVVADAVISGDVPLTHMAGGLGVVAEVLLPIGHDALWGAQSDTTAWYPALHLHRESLNGAWDGIWEALESVLNARTAQVGNPTAASATAVAS